MTAISDSTEHATAHNKLRQLRWNRIENFTIFVKKFLKLAQSSGLNGVPESQKINLFLQTLPPDFADKIQNTVRNRQNVNSEGQPTLQQIIAIAEQHSDVFRYPYSSWYIYGSQKFWLLFNYGMRNPQRFMTLSVLVLAILYWQFLTPTIKPDSTIGNFAALTNDIFVQINAVDIPSSDGIMEHTHEFKVAANMIDKSPAFASYGKPIANGLRQFSKDVVRAGNSLKEMYRKGSYVFETFQTEIETLFKIFDSKMTAKSKFFTERIKRMIKVVQEFRIQVYQAKNAMLDAENRRDDLETNIFAGLREVQKFIKDEWWNDQTDIAIAKRESEAVVNVLKCLQSAGKNLDTVGKMLDDYERNLLEVQAQL
ncbi:8394_t:CDS:2, partial [Paraglomus occultum]